MTRQIEDPKILAAEVLRSSRRRLLCGSGAVALATALAACGSDDSGDTGSDNPPASTPSTGTSDSTGEGPGDSGIANVADVPVGGGIVTDDLVIVQPEEGTVKAYSRSCPHQGSLVGAPEDGTITCPSHGSQFAVADGAVTKGPATSGLTEVEVLVGDDGTISRP